MLAANTRSALIRAMLFPMTVEHGKLGVGEEGPQDYGPRGQRSRCPVVLSSCCRRRGPGVLAVRFSHKFQTNELRQTNSKTWVCRFLRLPTFAGRKCFRAHLDSPAVPPAVSPANLCCVESWLFKIPVCQAEVRLHVFRVGADHRLSRSIIQLSPAQIRPNPSKSDPRKIPTVHQPGHPPSRPLPSEAQRRRVSPSPPKSDLSTQADHALVPP